MSHKTSTTSFHEHCPQPNLFFLSELLDLDDMDTEEASGAQAASSSSSSTPRRNPQMSASFSASRSPNMGGGGGGNGGGFQRRHSWMRTSLRRSPAAGWGIIAICTSWPLAVSWNVVYHKCSTFFYLIDKWLFPQSLSCRRTFSVAWPSPTQIIKHICGQLVCVGNFLRSHDKNLFKKIKSLYEKHCVSNRYFQLFPVAAPRRTAGEAA